MDCSTFLPETWLKTNFAKMNGIAFVVCRKHVGWKRSVDHFRQYGIATRIVQSIEFEDQESIHVIAAWHPFISGKHHKVREIDSTNAEMLRGEYNVGDSLWLPFKPMDEDDMKPLARPSRCFKASWMLDAADLTSITPLKQLKLAQEIRSALCFEKSIKKAC